MKEFLRFFEEPVAPFFSSILVVILLGVCMALIGCRTVPQVQPTVHFTNNLSAYDQKVIRDCTELSQNVVFNLHETAIKQGVKVTQGEVTQALIHYYNLCIERTGRKA